MQCKVFFTYCKLLKRSFETKFQKQLISVRTDNLGFGLIIQRYNLGKITSFKFTVVSKFIFISGAVYLT